MKQQIMAGLGLAVVAATLSGCGQGTQAGAESGEAQPIAQAAPVEAPQAEPVAAKTTAKKPLDVDIVAGKPAAHVGKVSVVGVVATSKAKEGFLLIGLREYRECGLSCLTEPGTKKLPVRWSGAAPKIKDTVHVEGTIVRTDKGFTFTAKKVGKA